MARTTAIQDNPSLPYVASVAPAPDPERAMYGLDSKSVKRQIEGINRVIIANAGRPEDMDYRITNMSNFWYMYERAGYYRRDVSLFSTIITRSTTEIFRYGLDFRPKFAKKCENPNCGYESQTMVDTCPVCGSARMRVPDPLQKNYFRNPSSGKSFLDDANYNHKPLVDVLKMYAESQYQNNQAYLLAVTGEGIREDNSEKEYSKVLEFIVPDPRKVRYLYDESGRPGTRYAFTRDDRNTLWDTTDEKDVDEMDRLTTEGKVLYPAHWMVGTNPGATGRYWVYDGEEVYQDQWFRPSMTYGIPILYDIEDDLKTYYYIEKHNLKKYMLGYVRKMIVLPGFNEDDVEDIQKGVTDVLSTNDNSIPIVCLPPQIPGTAEMKAQVLELGAESSQDLMLVKNDIRDRLCAHWGVPNIFAGDVEASGGMNNESQQITIYDRYLMDKYNYVDRICAWIMEWFPLITDWELCVNRPSKAYTDAKKRMDRIQEAQLMKQLGFDITFVDGEFRYSSEPIDQVQRKQQEAMMAMSGGMADGGLMPGDGDGPPEKGTARREDEEIDAAEDEIDLAKREAEGAYAA